MSQPDARSVPLLLLGVPDIIMPHRVHLGGSLTDPPSRHRPLQPLRVVPKYLQAGFELLGYGHEQQDLQRSPPHTSPSNRPRSPEAAEEG